MTCSEIQDRLPLFVYDDLDGPDALTLATHLADCPACQAAHAALMQMRAALDGARPPRVAVDAAALLRSASKHTTVQLRRWRRAALAFSALAASLLVLLMFRVQVRAGNGELVISWGEPRPFVAPSPASPLPASLPVDLDERVQLVQSLARALAAELDERDGRTRAEIVRVNGQLTALQRLSLDRWTETERDLAALYTAIRRPELGGKP